MVTDPVLELAHVRKRPLSFDSDESFADYLRDPRPMFAEDTDIWQELLTWAAAEDPEVHAALHCIRCGGARLGQEDGHLKFQGCYIDPQDDPEHGTAWETYQDFKLDCESILGPYRHQIQGLLEQMERQSKASEHLQV